MKRGIKFYNNNKTDIYRRGYTFYKVELWKSRKSSKCYNYSVEQKWIVTGNGIYEALQAEQSLRNICPAHGAH